MGNIFGLQDEALRRCKLLRSCGIEQDLSTGRHSGLRSPGCQARSEVAMPVDFYTGEQLRHLARAKEHSPGGKRHNSWEENWCLASRPPKSADPSVPINRMSLGIIQVPMHIWQLYAGESMTSKYACANEDSCVLWQSTTASSWSSLSNSDHPETMTQVSARMWRRNVQRSTFQALATATSLASDGQRMQCPSICPECIFPSLHIVSTAQGNSLTIASVGHLKRVTWLY